MGSHYYIVNDENTIKIENSISSEKWEENTLCCAEAQILLEAIKSIENGVEEMEGGKIATCDEKKKLKM